MSSDLFGDPIEEPEPDFAAEYEAYIHSVTWRRIADRCLERAKYCCEKCGRSHYSARLEVHHKHYRTFKHEEIDDLVVLCKDCHERADERRRELTERMQINSKKLSPLRKGFEGWMDKGNNSGWRGWNDTRLSAAWEEFCKHTVGKSVEFWRSPDWMAE